MIRQLRHWLRPRARLVRFRELVSRFGWRAAIIYFIQRWLGIVRSSLRGLHPPQAIYPLWVRDSSSDFAMFTQIFHDLEYGCLDGMTDVGLILDCGANVGYSSAYFLSHFPSCQVIAIEPDPNNFAMLQRNLYPYGNRVRMVHGGVWSRPAKLVISDIKYRDGGECTRQVRECRSDEQPDVEGIDITTLLEKSGHDQISILKVDIEGAEAVIFSDNYHSWIEKVDAIVIELHDDSFFGDASGIFYAAIKDCNFQMSRSGELIVCTGARRSRK